VFNSNTYLVTFSFSGLLTNSVAT